MPSNRGHNWEDIKIFLAVLRADNLSKAATDLKINHTTVLRRVRALQEALGVTLIKKTREGYRVTEQALLMKDLAEEIELKNNALFDSAYNLDSVTSGEVILTTTNTIYDSFLVPHLEIFKQSYPDIMVTVDLSTEPKDLLNYQADIAMRLTNSPPEYLIGTKLADVEFAIYKHKDIPDQRPMPIVAWTKDEQPEIWAKPVLGEVETSMRFSDFNSMLSAVNKGLGVAMLPKQLVALMGDRELTELNATTPLPSFGLWILNRAEHKHIERIRILRQFLVNALKS